MIRICQKWIPDAFLHVCDSSHAALIAFYQVNAYIPCVRIKIQEVVTTRFNVIGRGTQASILVIYFGHCCEKAGAALISLCLSRNLTSKLVVSTNVLLFLGYHAMELTLNLLQIQTNDINHSFDTWHKG